MAQIEKPKKTHVYCTVRTGKYNMCNPDEEQLCFSFHNLPQEVFADKELRVSRDYIISMRYEYDVDQDENTLEFFPLTVAEQLLEVVKKYLFNSDTKRLPVIIEWLKAHKLENDIAAETYARDYAAYQIEYWTQQRDAHQSELDIYLEEQKEVTASA